MDFSGAIHLRQLILVTYLDEAVPRHRGHLLSGITLSLIGDGADVHDGSLFWRGQVFGVFGVSAYRCNRR